jgi:hypothetical protein
MQPIRSYVVRIYRQDRRSIAGMVEEVRSGKSRFFHSFGDLWDALTARRAPASFSEANPAPSSDGAGP